MKLVTITRSPVLLKSHLASGVGFASRFSFTVISVRVSPLTYFLRSGCAEGPYTNTDQKSYQLQAAANGYGGEPLNIGSFALKIIITRV